MRYFYLFLLERCNFFNKNWKTIKYVFYIYIYILMKVAESMLHNTQTIFFNIPLLKI